jgi:hypothetical protein
MRLRVNAWIDPVNNARSYPFRLRHHLAVIPTIPPMAMRDSAMMSGSVPALLPISSPKTTARAKQKKTRDHEVYGPVKARLEFAP